MKRQENDDLEKRGWIAICSFGSSSWQLSVETMDHQAICSFEKIVFYMCRYIETYICRYVEMGKEKEKYMWQMYFCYLIRLFKDLFKTKSWRRFLSSPPLLFPLVKTTYLKFTLESLVLKGIHKVHS